MGRYETRVRAFLLTMLLLLCYTPQTIAQTAPVPADNRAAENLPTEAKSLTEVNKELSTPISSIWAIAFQQNTYWLNKPERNNVNLQFQPALPMSLTQNWNLITVGILMNSTPYLNESGNLHRVTGFGDTVLVSMLSLTESSG